MISYTNKYFTKNGDPWFPIMGEYEYSRTERREWCNGIAKMKALGLNSVQSYVLWICHEEIKGHYNFRGNNNLRAFLRTVKEAGMGMCLRIGPWVHAELRNGGFPDWIFEQGYKPRTNDPRYLADVESYFKEIYRQCEGYFISQDGPIFAIQIENEFGEHTAGSREEGNLHFNYLMDMLKRIGFDVPIYFATAWNNAVIGKALPTFGEYAAQPWELHTRSLPPTASYLIANNQNEIPAGKYEDFPATVTADGNKRYFTPYMTVEQGAGNQPTKTRRPIVTGEDNGAMAFCRIAQGVSGFGYYVFHGGINPVGTLYTTQEYRNFDLAKTRDGYTCDLAERNYDFQSAVNMYNRITENGKELKIWNLFASEFWNILCDASVEPCENNATDPEDFTSPRWAVRRNGDSGFLFYNNYIRRFAMPTKELKGFTFNTKEGQITLPDVTMHNGDFEAFPFNIKYGNAVLEYATATPLCILNNDTIVLFNKNGQGEYSLKGNGKVLLLSKEDARNAFKIKKDGKEYLIVTEGEIYPRDEKYVFEYTKGPSFKIYPNPEKIDGFEYQGACGDFHIYKYPENASKKVFAKFTKTAQTDEFVSYTVNITYGDTLPSDVYLKLGFSADYAEILIDGEKVNDMYYTGLPFDMSLRYYDFPKEITLRLHPLKQGSDIYLEKEPDYINGVAASLDFAEVEISNSINFRI